MKDLLTLRTSISNHPHFRRICNVFIYQIYTIWLCTLSDLKTITIPASIYGLIGAFSGAPLLSDSLPPRFAISRVPHVLFWTWSTLAINNQSSESAVLKDALKKPWRPMPSRRTSVMAANTLMMAMYGSNMFMSFILGTHRHALSMLLLGICYNRLGEADFSCVEKNFINAVGYISFITGALVSGRQS
ncbi:UbiA prenyltransferase [Paraphaeosphaeria sporulosa]